jgi:hypothetical protein
MTRSIRLVLALAALTASLPAQTGEITGIVTDPAGAAIPAARVSIHETSTGARRSVTTNAEGVYAAPAGNRTRASARRRSASSRLAPSCIPRVRNSAPPSCARMAMASCSTKSDDGACTAPSAATRATACTPGSSSRRRRSAYPTAPVRRDLASAPAHSSRPQGSRAGAGRSLAAARFSVTSPAPARAGRRARATPAPRRPAAENPCASF